MDKSIEIVLLHPIIFGDSEIKVLYIRRPKGRDFRELGGFEKPLSALLDFGATLADVPPAVMDMLDADDVPKVIEVVSNFLPTSLGTGKKS